MSVRTKYNIDSCLTKRGYYTVRMLVWLSEECLTQCGGRPEARVPCIKIVVAPPDDTVYGHNDTFKTAGDSRSLITSDLTL